MVLPLLFQKLVSYLSEVKLISGLFRDFFSLVIAAIYRILESDKRPSADHQARSQRVAE